MDLVDEEDHVLALFQLADVILLTVAGHHRVEPTHAPLGQQLEGLAAASALAASGDLDETYEEEVVI